MIGKHSLKARAYFELNDHSIFRATGVPLGSYNFAGGNVLNPHDAGDGWANAYLGNINQYSEGHNSGATGGTRISRCSSRTVGA